MPAWNPKAKSQKKLEDLLNEEENSNPSCDDQTSIPKIERVQPYLRQRPEFKNYYDPKLISIGSIHHDCENLKLGEQQKRKWTKAYLKEAKRPAKELRQEIANNIKELKKLYTEDAIEKYKDEEDLIWMLFVDGCSVLHVLKNADDWFNKAPEKLQIKIDQLALLLRDMLLLENQLPHKLLWLLSDDKHHLDASMLKLLQNHNLLGNPNQLAHSNGTNQLETSTIITIESPPAHLLDLLYRTLLEPSPNQSSKPQGTLAGLLDCLPKPRQNTGSANGQTLESERSGGLHKIQHLTFKVRNIQELKAAGIGVKNNKNARLKDVEFTSDWLWGHLHLPKIIVDDFTAPTFLNLIAYEMCPDFPNKFEISSYVAFLDVLIDHPDDVKDLRSAGVLQNHLGSDEEVAKLFNKISTDLIADAWKYATVRDQIEKHCEFQIKTWMTQVVHDHFSSPWTVIAFLTVVLVTGLTIVQTWFTIKPPG